MSVADDPLTIEQNAYTSIVHCKIYVYAYVTVYIYACVTKNPKSILTTFKIAVLIKKCHNLVWCQHTSGKMLIEWMSFLLLVTQHWPEMAIELKYIYVPYFPAYKTCFPQNKTRSEYHTVPCILSQEQV